MMSKFDQENWYGGSEFQFLGSYYERDSYSGRCYRMEASVSLRREMDGWLVRRRISRGLYQAMIKGLN
jgi:hypothetical protein